MIRRLSFPLTGCLLVGQVDAEFTFTGQERLPGGGMAFQSQTVGLCQTLDFILSLAHPGFVQFPEQIVRVCVSGNITDQCGVADHRQAVGIIQQRRLG